jgi:hypothetical protein
MNVRRRVVALCVLLSAVVAPATHAASQDAAAGSTTLRVVTAKGTPVAEADVALQRDGDRTVKQRLRTGEDGTVVLPDGLVSGRYAMTIAHKGMTWRTAYEHLSTVGQDTEVAIELIEVTSQGGVNTHMTRRLLEPRTKPGVAPALP